MRQPAAHRKFNQTLSCCPAFPAGDPDCGPADAAQPRKTRAVRPDDGALATSLSGSPTSATCRTRAFLIAAIRRRFRRIADTSFNQLDRRQRCIAYRRSGLAEGRIDLLYQTFKAIPLSDRADARRLAFERLWRARLDAPGSRSSPDRLRLRREETGLTRSRRSGDLWNVEMPACVERRPNRNCRQVVVEEHQRAEFAPRPCPGLVENRLAVILHGPR